MCSSDLSEDIRLNDKLTVTSYGQVLEQTAAPVNPVSASTNNDKTPLVFDGNLRSAWVGNKGDYITFALENGAKVDGLSIAFDRANGLDADFEIQLSGGGGQFLTVYTGTVNAFNKLIPFQFKGTTASDLRIVLHSDLLQRKT